MKYIKVVRRLYPPLIVSLFFKSFENHDLYKEYLNLDYTMRGAKNIDYNYFYPEYHMITLPKIIINKLKTNPREFEQLKRTCRKYEKALQVSKGFYDFCQNMINYAITISIHFICDDVIEQEVRNKLLLKTIEEETEQLMEKLSIPEVDNFNIIEKLSILRNTKEKHYDLFKWFRSRFGQKIPYPIDSFDQMKRELENQNYLEKYIKEKHEIKQAIKIAKNLLNKDAILIDIMQYLIYYRTHRTDIINKAIYFAKEILDKEAKHHNLNYEELLFCTYDEITKEIPSKKIIKERQKGFSIIDEEGIITIFSGEKHKKLINKYLIVNKNTNILVGRPTYKGKTYGPVKLIKSVKDINDFPKDHILVAHMTTPNMVHTLKKCKAIVTDEGGITCHAAIISREFKIPCIIGTEKATKVFKNGDLVEVDANKGIITKVTTQEYAS